MSQKNDHERATKRKRVPRQKKVVDCQDKTTPKTKPTRKSSPPETEQVHKIETKTFKETGNFSDLRRKAEKLAKDGGAALEELSGEDAARLIHELHVHQIELELQNEELRRTQIELAESAQKYSDLYDFAPVGCLIVDRLGKILEANLTAASLLGKERSRLPGFFFPVLLTESDRHWFRQILHNKSDLQEWQGEINLTCGGGILRPMLVRTLFLLDAKGREIWRITLTDISELKKAQEALQQAQDELEGQVAALRDSEQKLRLLTSQILTAQEQERQRIARDLHDEMGQSLVVLNMQLNAFKRRIKRGEEAWEEFDQALDFVNVIAEQVRGICQTLWPTALENRGINGALRELLAEFQKHHGLAVAVELDDLSGLLSPEAQITVYRVFQECLTNAVRHGKATSIKVCAHQGEGAVHFACEDNGTGFDLKEVKFRRRLGLGLAAMGERVRLLRGSFEITSAKDQGTRIDITLPLNKK